MHGLSGGCYPARLRRGRVNQTVKAWGGLHILVNNAGFTWDALVHKMTDQQWEAMLAAHLTAPFRLIRATGLFSREAAKEEKAAGKIVNRKIINVSSLVGIRGNSGQKNYVSAKAGIVGLARPLSKEWGALDVQVNALAYGWIDTRLTGEKELGGRSSLKDSAWPSASRRVCGI